jgi:hypothetical protein
MYSESNHNYRVKMNVIDYIMITCNLKNGRLQITSDYMKKCNQLQLITITPCLPTSFIDIADTCTNRKILKLYPFSTK